MFDSGVYLRDFLLLLPGVWRFSLSASETKKQGTERKKQRKTLCQKDAN